MFRIVAPADLVVERVDGGGDHAHQQLTRLHVGNSHVPQLEAVRSTELLEHHRLHRTSPVGGQDERTGRSIPCTAIFNRTWMRATPGIAGGVPSGWALVDPPPRDPDTSAGSGRFLGPVCCGCFLRALPSPA